MTGEAVNGADVFRKDSAESGESQRPDGGSDQVTWRDMLAEGRVIMEITKERRNVIGQYFRLFHGREVSSGRHFSPTSDVVPSFNVVARRKRIFEWKTDDANGYFDKVVLFEMQGSPAALVVQPE
jgi:hypothetical protein